MKRINTPVSCCRCGKTLRGTPGVMPRCFHVARHKQPDGSRCSGHLDVYHTPIRLRAKPLDTS